MASIDPNKKRLVADIIRKLHAGLSVEEAKASIQREVGTLTSTEITEIEQTLIDEGVSPDEIRRFCNVHALLFESALEKAVADPELPQHPVNLLKRENREIEGIIAQAKEAAGRADTPATRAALARLRGVERHYELKENALFPALERHGFPGPSKVMWSKHNEVRALFKQLEANSSSGAPDPALLDSLLAEVSGMIFKEENILYPAALERIPAGEWVAILKACDEIGYAFATGAGLHATLMEAGKLDTQAAAMGAGEIGLPSGRFSLEELTATLNALPVDITFVDSEDRVKYFSQSKDRIFVRATSVLGRNVANCHPPQSVHVVQEIVDAFRAGTRDHADFWIKLRGRLIYIRYFAVRNPDKKYLGTLEVTQDISDVRELDGEHRLLDSV
jgi:DUF438 domain-containing protein